MKDRTEQPIVFCPSVLAEIQTLIQRRNFDDALMKLTASESEMRELSGRQLPELYRLKARALKGQGKLDEALVAIHHAQKHAEDQHDQTALAESYLVLAEILRDQNHMRDAQRACRDAESLFRRIENREGQCRSLNQLAGLYFRQSDYQPALEALLEAAELARRLGDTRKLAYMMGNIGRIYSFTGHVAEAEHHLKTNIELSLTCADTLEAARAQLSLGYLYLQQAEYVQAESSFAIAYQNIVAAGSRRDEVIYLTYMGELRTCQARLKESVEYLQQAIALGNQLAANSPLVARAMRHLAEVMIRMNKTRQAAIAAEESMAIYQASGDKTEEGALWKIKGQLAELRGDSPLARECFDRALTMLEQCGNQVELVNALITLGQSSIYPTRQAMFFLFRAEEFFARHRMTIRLETIGLMIAARDSHHVAGRATVSRIAGETSVDYVSSSLAIKRFKEQLPILGSSDLPLLLTGETGVGKDRMARYYHSVVRPKGPFVAINCASIPETLLESELFGYRKGAFSGADRDKDGLFVAANGGVLFLDEIGDMPLPLQAKLLGVLERRRFIPLGSTSEVSLDIKVVAATNQPLEQFVEQGRFRRDLYYRLSGIGFNIPPLRERLNDIGLLLGMFLREHGLLATGSEVPEELVRRFSAYDWPGNIRELENKVKRLSLMAQSVNEGDLVELGRSLLDPIEKGSLSQPVYGSSSATAEGSIAIDGDESLSLFERVEEFERKLLVQALTSARGNKSEAARLLGVHEATVRLKLKRYGVALEGGSVH